MQERIFHLKPIKKTETGKDMKLPIQFKTIKRHQKHFNEVLDKQENDFSDMASLYEMQLDNDYTKSHNHQKNIILNYNNKGKSLKKLKTMQ